jgi:predicted Co/Zn/Cd cation transporter (cation efflux family)
MSSATSMGGPALSIVTAIASSALFSLALPSISPAGGASGAGILYKSLIVGLVVAITLYAAQWFRKQRMSRQNQPKFTASDWNNWVEPVLLGLAVGLGVTLGSFLITA